MTRNYVVAAGGLGNQLFQVAAALATNPDELVLLDFSRNVRKNETGMADISDFELDTPINWNFDCGRKVFFRRFTNFLFRQSVQKRSFVNRLLHSHLGIIFIKYLYSAVLKSRICPVVATDNGYFDIKSTRTPNLYIGYFQSYFWATQERTSQKLRSMKLINENNLKSLLSQKKKEVTVVCVHIRMGDYKFEPDFGMLSSEYYAEALKLILRKNYFDEIWLFSDEPMKAIEKIPEKFSDKIWIVPKLSAAETLELMRYGNYYVVANSSFSWWGAMLSKIPNPVVVAPDKWFKRLDDPKLLIPSSWIRVKANFDS